MMLDLAHDTEKEKRMEVFGIVGMSMGTLGFIFAMSALDQIKKLEKRLKDSGVLEKDQQNEVTEEQS